MKNEILTVLKTIAIVTVSVLLADEIKNKLLSRKVNAPIVAQTKE